MLANVYLFAHANPAFSFHVGHKIDRSIHGQATSVAGMVAPWLKYTIILLVVFSKNHLYHIFSITLIPALETITTTCLIVEPTQQSQKVIFLILNIKISFENGNNQKETCLNECPQAHQL